MGKEVGGEGVCAKAGRYPPWRPSRIYAKLVPLARNIFVCLCVCVRVRARVSVHRRAWVRALYNRITPLT